MGEIYVGCEVVCVFVGPLPGRLNFGPSAPVPMIVEGSHYRVSGLDSNPANEGLGLFLEGVDSGFYSYSAERFRPVRREQIQIFLDIAASVKPTVPVGA